MSAHPKFSDDTYEDIVDKLCHITTIGYLLVNNSSLDHYVKNAGDLIIEQATAARSSFDEIHESWKRGSS